MPKKAPASSPQSPEDELEIPVEENVSMPEYTLELETDDSGIELPKFHYVDHDVTFGYDLVKVAKVSHICVIYFYPMCFYVVITGSNLT